MLDEGEKNVGEIGVILGSTFSTVSNHLSLMRCASVVQRKRQGKNNIYSLTDLGRAALDAALLISGQPED
jgi:DNA-binding transcriptional ArsR family regulator